MAQPNSLLLTNQDQTAAPTGPTSTRTSPELTARESDNSLQISDPDQNQIQVVTTTHTVPTTVPTPLSLPTIPNRLSGSKERTSSCGGESKRQRSSAGRQRSTNSSKNRTVLEKQGSTTSAGLHSNTSGIGSTGTSIESSSRKGSKTKYDRKTVPANQNDLTIKQEISQQSGQQATSSTTPTSQSIFKSIRNTVVQKTKSTPNPNKSKAKYAKMSMAEIIEMKQQQQLAFAIDRQDTQDTNGSGGNNTGNNTERTMNTGRSSRKEKSEKDKDHSSKTSESNEQKAAKKLERIVSLDNQSLHPELLEQLQMRASLTKDVDGVSSSSVIRRDAFGPSETTSQNIQGGSQYQRDSRRNINTIQKTETATKSVGSLESQDSIGHVYSVNSDDTVNTQQTRRSIKSLKRIGSTVNSFGNDSSDDILMNSNANDNINDRSYSSKLARVVSQNIVSRFIKSTYKRLSSLRIN